jgi:hypothetical protein
MTKKLSKKNVQGKKKPNTARGQSAGASDSSLAKRLDQLMQRIPKGTFAAAGRTLGGPMGAMAGKAISNISGYGDYAVGHNTVGRQGTHGGVEVPSFSNKSVRITHREYFGSVVVPARDDVNVASAYNVDTYALDPTSEVLAPWVSTIAKRFGKYKIHGLVVYYKPTSPDYGNSGTLAIAVNTDPAERPFESLSGILNTKFAVSAKPSIALVAPVECDPSTLVGGGTMLVNHPQIYKSGAVIDSRFTSMGTLNVATEGLTLPPGTVLGQLHMTIDLELIAPFYHVQLDPNPTSAAYARLGKAASWEKSYGVQPTGVAIRGSDAAGGINPQGVWTTIDFADVGVYHFTLTCEGSVPGNDWLITSKDGAFVSPGTLYEKYSSGSFNFATFLVQNTAAGGSITVAPSNEGSNQSHAMWITGIRTGSSIVDGVSVANGPLPVVG